MPWAAAGAVIGAAGSIASGVMGANAAEDASKRQQQSQQDTLNWIKNVYSGSEKNLQPFIGGGQSALGSLMGFYGLPGGNSGGAQQSFQSFQNTPFYQFPLQQANLETSRALAASGLIGSGAQLRDVSKLNAGYASQGFGQYLSGLGGLANSGQNAASSLGNIGNSAGGIVGGANTQYGNAGAAGIMGANNSLTSGMGGAIGALTNPNAISAFKGLSQSSYGSGQSYASVDPYGQSVAPLSYYDPSVPAS